MMLPADRYSRSLEQISLMIERLDAKLQEIDPSAGPPATNTGDVQGEHPDWTGPSENDQEVPSQPDKEKTPSRLDEEQTPPQPKALPKITPDKWPGYEKQCLKCGHVMPFDSIYCSFCGATLRRARAPEVKFCRYCGNRMHFIGEFCPDCGREINLISKPKVYVSE